MRRILTGFLIGLSLDFGAVYAAEKEVITRNSKQFHAQMNLNQMTPLTEHTDAQGRRHVRYQQKYEGVPVWGAYVSKHQTAATQTRLHGVLYHRLKEDLGEKPESLQNTSRVLAFIKTMYPRASVQQQEIQSLIYIDDDHRARWAYVIFVLVEYMHARPKKLFLILDAETLQIYKKWDTIKTLKKVEALGFGGNVRVGKIQYGRDSATLKLVRDEVKEQCLMQNEFVSVLDMHSQYGGVSPIAAFSCENDAKDYWTGIQQDGYDEVNQAYSPINDALYIGTVIHEMFSNWYHVDTLGGTDSSPKTLFMRVHYGKSYENAFWDGRQMSFGDGGKSMYPLVVVTVAAHEIAHGFTEHHSNLFYIEQSGAINEAFSDITAQAVEYYLYGKNSWTIAAEAMKETTKALRYMMNPSLDGQSINHASDYYKGIDVHHASGVYNRFFYLLAHAKGWNTKKAFDVMLKANMDYWVPTSNYNDAACGVLWDSSR